MYVLVGRYVIPAIRRRRPAASAADDCCGRDGTEEAVKMPATIALQAIR